MGTVILTIEDARYVAKCFKDYYLRFESIQIINMSV